MMVWRRSRKGFEMAMSTIIVLVLLIILLLAWGIPMINKLISGGNSLFVCASPNQCMTSCDPNGYMYYHSGDTACQDKTKGGQAGMVCCEPLALAPGQIARAGDVQLYLGGDLTNPIPNGGSINLNPQKGGIIGATFSFIPGPSLAGKLCYGQFSWGNNPPVNINLLGSPPLETLFQAQDISLPNPVPIFTVGTDTGVNCTALKTSTTIPLSLSPTDYQYYLGQQLKYSIIVTDPTNCPDCQPYVYSFTANVPARHPTISLQLDGKSVTPGVLTAVTTGTPHTLNLKITDPLQTCQVTTQADMLGPSSVPSGLPTPSTNPMEPNCFNYAPYQQQYSFTIPATVPGGIPFSLLVNTSMTASSTLSASKSQSLSQVAKYLFQVAPEQRIQVVGPPGGLTKTKTVTVTCNSNVACSQVVAATVQYPYLCHSDPGGTSTSSFGFNASNGAGGNTFTFTFQNETDNGHYVCIKASTTNAGDIYSLGLWNGQLNPLTIDHTPPVLTLNFDSIQGLLTFTCVDKPGPFPSGSSSPNAYVSGCKNKPFSYAYIQDPVNFLTYVITGGATGGATLLNTFQGCPDPDATQGAVQYGSSYGYTYAASSGGPHLSPTSR